MAGQNLIYKVLSAFKGLDLRSSDILRESDFATDMQNSQYRATGALNKRKGFKYASSKGTGGFGHFTYKNVNTTTGVVTEEVISIDNNLTKLTSYTFNITYTGSGDAAYLVYVKEGTTNEFYFKVLEDGETTLDYNIGTGLEGSPVTITTLVSAIDALANFTAGTISGSGSSPAALVLPISDDQVVIDTGAGTTITFTEWADISTPTGYSNPFTNFYAKRTATDFENATFAQVNDVLYIATGWDELHKYDGTRVYRAGMPQATTPTAASSGASAGSFPNNRALRYKVVNRYTDAKGNVTEGEISSHVAVTTSGSGHSINVSYTELAGSAGWDVDGTLQYLIYRTDDSADATDTSLYYLVATRNQSDSSPWTDTGIAEGAEYVTPIKTPGLPPKCKYVDTWRNQLLLSGNPLAVDTVYYSDVTSPEHFPSSDNSFIIPNKVTGARVLDQVFFVFEENAINAITGDLASDNFQVDPLSREGIGCASHHSIQEVEGALFFLSKRGVYRIAPGMPRPEHIGENISPEFKKGNAFSFKQAVGFTWQSQDKYLLFMPVLPVDPSYSNDATNVLYVYDYYRQAWKKWTNVNFHGGACEANGDLFFSSRTESNFHCNKMSQTGSMYDYADHTDAIEFVHKSSWETLGEASQWKKFLRLKVHAYDTTINDFESQIFSITCKQEIDWLVGTTYTIATMDFSGGSSGWGADAWGEFPWGQARLTQIQRKMVSKKAKSTRIIFENSELYQNVLISGYSMQVALSYQNMMHE